jgi:replicative DNA helicase Mcm
MPYGEQVDLFEEFFIEMYKDRLAKIQSRGDKALVIDFNDLERYNPELADEVLEEPEQLIEGAEEALTRLSIVETELNIRFENLPDQEYVRIRDLRSDHLSTLTAVEGIVKRASEVRPEVVSADFECTACGDIVTKEQDSAKLKTPYKCDCGNRKFEEKDKEMVDVQVITVEENPQNIKGSEQPQDIGIYLRDDLVDPDFQRNITPGNEVVVNGVLQEAPQKKDSKRYELYVESNYLTPIQREFEEINITDEAEAEIKALGTQDNIFEKIVSSIAPSIHGHERVKEAIALQMFGGVRKERPDGTSTRGDMHMLLIGEPGTGKSQLLKFAGDLAPKGKYVVGKSATGAGITATVVKDEMTDQWALEAGALVLANKGLATIDEIDKMSPEDRSSLHEAMEQQQISVSKANIQATLQCQTSILAAGNPKFGRFDPYQPIPEQINIGDTLLSRFDLIFPVRDIPDKDRDTKLADHIMTMHTDPEDHVGSIDKDLLQKYIAYAKKNIHPDWTEAAEKQVKEFYVSIRNKGNQAEDGEKSVPMTARQLEALIRMGEATARAKMKEKIEKEDAQQAIDLLTYCLKQIGTDPETGEFDIDRIESGISGSERNRLQTVQKIIRDLQGGDDDPVPLEDVLAEAEEAGISEDATNEVINRLKREGELFEPKNGHIQPI